MAISNFYSNDKIINSLEFFQLHSNAVIAERSEATQGFPASNSKIAWALPFSPGRV
ncbi:hypothetical protein ACD661_12945 [Legionella lytica]|uniref:Uncharacterized protein n=1 Tax=Legionella lytica TaxID=96232 RepID=A0ABW8D9T0_9GAMM